MTESPASALTANDLWAERGLVAYRNRLQAHAMNLAVKKLPSSLTVDR